VTLVQVLADETSLHMACDFCLSDPDTGRVVRNDAFKLVTVTSSSMLALIGVTGKSPLDGKPIGTWIEDVVSGLDGRRSVQDVLDALAHEAAGPLSRIAGDRRHTFVVGAIIGSQTQVSLVSNFQVFARGRIEDSSTAAKTLRVSSIKPKSPQHLATRSVSSADRQQLELMLRSGATDQSIKERLREVNVAVSDRATDVSAGCYVASLHATGRGSSKSFLTDKQKGDVIPPAVIDDLPLGALRLKPKIGPDGKPMPIRVVQSGFGMEGWSAEYFREQIKLQPKNPQLRDRHGSYLVSKGKLDEATDAFELAKTLDPSYAPAIAHLAQQHWLHKGGMAEADRLYTEAINVPGSPAPAWILSGYAVFCDLGLAETQRAGDLHERAVEAENFPLAKARLGYFLMKHGQEIERVNALLSAALEPPDNPDVLEVAGRADWFLKGDREAARTKLEKACTLAPTYVPILRLTAYLCLTLEDGHSAAYYYRKVIGRSEPDWQLHANYGLALLMDRKPKGALEQLSKARRSGPDDPTVPVNIAATLWVLRRSTEAIALMREVLGQSLPPGIEIEVLAMLRLAAPPATKEMIRLRDLITRGNHGDGITIRSMVRDRPKIERNLGSQLSDIIEGKAPLPGSL
jgi:Tfp pilus assembly protein PilF